MEITNQALIIIIVIAAINLIAFLLMFLDKLKAANLGSSRISEGMLFFLATVFGSLGVYIGMFIFHHKTKKWYFLIGIPLLFIQNLATTLLIYLYLFNK